MPEKVIKKDIALVEHPCSFEQKMELRREGLRVIDVRQKDNVNPARVVKTVMNPKKVSKDDAAKDALEAECKKLTGVDLDKRKSLVNMQKDFEAAKAASEAK